MELHDQTPATVTTGALIVRRILRAGQMLYAALGPGSQPGCKAVAGYLFGLAGELAVKQMMSASGMRELSSSHRRDDPFFAHFPELKTHLARTAQGRRWGELRTFAEDPKLFRNWNTDMRYAPTADINAEWVDGWKVSAEQLVARMDV